MSIVDELAPELIKRKAVGYECASQLLITAGDNPQSLASLLYVASALYPFLPAKQIVTDLTVAAIVQPTALCILLR